MSGQLKKTVNLTPFKLGDPEDFDYAEIDFDPQYADDIIYGGLGSDSIHSGDGDDAVSGAEALSMFYDNPVNNGNVLHFNLNRFGEFAAYDEYDPMHKVHVDETGTFSYEADAKEFLLNFNAQEGEIDNRYGTEMLSDGDDLIFGDIGNDWLVGGTGKDHLYGGYGNDLLNVDDDHDTNGDLNNIPDTDPTYEDYAYGGAGRDVLIANTGGDRMIDWAGEFNSYLVPFAPFGHFTISRSPAPWIREFLYIMSKDDGVDMTRAEDTGSDVLRNGEPEGELGVVMQKDRDWHDQTGAPDDPQPGNIPGGPRDVLRSATFNSGTMEAFAPDSGVWEVESGKLQVSAESTSGDAVSVFHVPEALPLYFELSAVIQSIKPIAGWKANAYVIFDYHSPTDFKFAGVNISIDKLQVGHRDSNGWHVDVQKPAKLKPERNYEILVAINGVTITVLVDGTDLMTHVYEPRIIDGYAYGLNIGMVGFGSENARGSFDNIAVQVLPPEYTLEHEDDFNDGLADLFTGASDGSWSIDTDHYSALPDVEDDKAFSLIDLGTHLLENSVLEMKSTFNTNGMAGFIFDYYDSTDFKFAAISAETNEIIIGYHTARRGWRAQSVISKTINAGQDYEFGIIIKGRTLSITLDDQMVTGHVYNGVAVDGRFGLLADDASSYDVFSLKTNDKQFVDPDNADPLEAACDPTDNVPVPVSLTFAELDSVLNAAINRWTISDVYNPNMITLLTETEFMVADLSGKTLGLTVGSTIIIDSDAAGHGWYVDDNPYIDSEFIPQTGNNELLTANSGSIAYERIDLLTVLFHELGHRFGFIDIDPETSIELMTATINTGERRLPLGATQGKINDHDPDLISIDLTIDAEIAPSILETLLGENSWLLKYFITESNSTDYDSGQTIPPPSPPVNNDPVIASLDVSQTNVDAGTPITLTASGVSDLDGEVTKVEFYLKEGDDLVLLGQDTNAADGWDYIVDTSCYNAGSYEFVAIAFDNESAQSQQQSVLATVTVPLTETTTLFNNDSSVSIPTSGTIQSTINISETGTISDVNVSLTIDHERMSDLRVYLVGPDGTRIELFSNIGGNSNVGFHQTILDDKASQSITSGSGTFTGYFSPEDNLSTFNKQDLNGDWILEIEDTKNKNSGTLQEWSLEITYMPSN